MTASAADSNFPTMIIPKGTEIKINQQGQLSIKTPGNLVIQNSGNYSELESTNGSIRIEENVQVEAVSVKAAQACFIQGTLTAWRVTAKKIALEDRARANIMLQESEQLELSKNSRLVGNFANEKEIYLLLGKFSPQLKQLPAAIDVTSPPTHHQGEITHPASSPSLQPPPPPPAASTAPPPPPLSSTQPMQSVQAPPPAASATTPPAREDLPDGLKQALFLLEQELRKPELDPRTSETLRVVAFALREQDLTRLGQIYRDAFSELGTPSQILRSAYNHIDHYFMNR